MTGEPGDLAATTAPRAGLRGSLIMGAARVASALPEAPLVAGADAIGELWYRTAPAKRDQARANLLRVCESLAETGRGPGRARRAATDPAALERLVRATFRHAARYYLEVLRVGAQTPASALARIDVESPQEVRDALQSHQAGIIVGMHFGAIELPVVVVSDMVGHPVTAPMEMVSDPGLAHWFVTTRSRVGVNIIPIEDARRPLLAAIKRGEPVGLVADRDIAGNGVPTPFFGHPAPIPVGPALLALETGVPVYVAAARRTKGGRYAGRLIRLEAPTEGTRRERLTEYMARITRGFETLIADAPEQWWGSFHPIWPDLAVGHDDDAEAPGSPDGGPAPAAPAAPDGDA